MIKLYVNFNITANQIEEMFNEFMETYPNGYKGHTITEHNGLYDVSIAYDDTGTAPSNLVETSDETAPANLVESSAGTVKASSKKGGEVNGLHQ